MLSDSKNIVNPNPAPYRRQCEELHNQLIDAMRKSVDVLIGSKESLSMSRLLLTEQTAREKKAFYEVLNPESRAYKTNITVYASYLADELKEAKDFEHIFSDEFPSEKDDSEIATLFRSPKKV